MWQMWGSRERVESIITPRLRTWGEGETMVPSIVSVGELVSLLKLDLEPMRRIVGGFSTEVNLGIVGVTVKSMLK